jgi:hypothetical protein
MDLLVFLKQAADIGLTAPTIVVLGMFYQQQKTNALLDKRVSILESKVKK